MAPRIIAIAGIAVAGLLAAACPAANGYVAVPVFPNARVDGATGMYAIPGDPNSAALVAQDGRVFRIDLRDPTVDRELWLDVRDRMVGNPATEEGLLGLAFAPDYATSRRIYVHYTADAPRRSVIARFTDGAERVILEVPQPYDNHNGGALAFGPDGMLYIAFGDGGSAGDPQGNAQNVNSLLGKILRIDVRGDAYAIPADNPFAGGGGRGEIWAWGLRNPWRISFDRATGQLWAADVGQSQWEEVNRVVGGANYGWNILEGDACYRASACDRSRSLPPRSTYSHEFGCSVTGGYVYRGAALPEMQGWYVYGDYCSGRVWAVDAGADSGAAIPLADTGVKITSFFEAADGELYIVSQNDGIFGLARKP